MGQIVIPYKPREWAKPFHSSFARFLALVLHRRAGKTTSFTNHLQRAATDDEWERQRLKHLVPELTEDQIKELLRDRFYALFLPTYKQAKLVVWDMLKYFARPIPGIKTNESELMVTYPNGSRFVLFGADNPDSFRGIGPSGVAYDEYSQMPANIHSEVLSKALADHLGFAIFGGTIKGKNQLYRTYEALEGDPKAFTVWQDIDQSLKRETGATIVLLKRALEDDRDLVKKGLMTQAEFEQEWYLSPTAAIKGSVFGSEMLELEKSGRITIVPYDKALKVHTVWDRGVGANLVVGFYQKSLNQLKKIDTWQGDGNEGLPEALKALQNKPYVYGKHFGPHDIEGTDASSGKTWKETAQELGFTFDVVPKIPVKDRIMKAQLALSRTWVDEKKNAVWIDAMQQYHYPWDDRRGMLRDEPYHDWASHFADEYSYAAVIEDLMTEDFDVAERVQEQHENQASTRRDTGL